MFCIVTVRHTKKFVKHCSTPYPVFLPESFSPRCFLRYIDGSIECFAEICLKPGTFFLSTAEQGLEIMCVGNFSLWVKQL